MLFVQLLHERIGRCSSRVWRGAVPDQAAVQVNVGFGGGANWMEEVTADDYNGRRR
jgi:hypothetical protein